MSKKQMPSCNETDRGKSSPPKGGRLTQWYFMVKKKVNL